LRLVISPTHVLLLEALDVAGRWDLFEEWKRRLVDVLAREAELSGAKPFRLWDFTGYSAVNRERVPDSTPLVGYMDPGHALGWVGNRVLDRVFRDEVPSIRLPAVESTGDDFGVSIHRGNLEAHLASI